MKKQKEGFTLVELLVVVVIIGIIAIIAIPSVNTIKEKNEQKKYQKYKESVNIAGELFTDSYHEDMFGITGDGCYDISYDELAKKNLVKNFNTSGISCKTPDTFVQVKRKNGKYEYITSIKCVDANKNVVYEDVREKCEHKEETKEVKPVITVDVKDINSWGDNWSNKKEITVHVRSDLGLNSNVQLEYGFTKDKNVKPTVMAKHRCINKHGDKETSFKFVDDSNTDGSKKDGKYYLYIDGVVTLDIGAHHAESVWTGPLNYDNSNPNLPTINNPNDNVWKGKKFVDDKNYVFDVSSADGISGVAYYQYRYPESHDSSEVTWNTYANLEGNKITVTPLIKERNHKMEIRACDYANNCSSPQSTQIKIDKKSPKIDSTTNTSDNIWTNQHVKITANASDAKLATNQAGSGVAKIVYTYDKEELDDWDEEIDGKVVGTWIANRNQKVYMYAYDKAGNKSARKDAGTVKIDTVKPECSLYLTEGILRREGVYIKPVTISILNKSDDKSGLSSFGIGNSTTPKYNSKLSFQQKEKADLTVYGYVKDTAGNENQCSYSVKVVPPYTCKPGEILDEDGGLCIVNKWKHTVSKTCTRSSTCTYYTNDPVPCGSPSSWPCGTPQKPETCWQGSDTCYVSNPHTYTCDEEYDCSYEEDTCGDYNVHNETQCSRPADES